MEIIKIDETGSIDMMKYIRIMKLAIRMKQKGILYLKEMLKLGNC